jgi:hypothetical protein
LTESDPGCILNQQVWQSVRKPTVKAVQVKA